MGLVIAYNFATFVVILITHETIFPVKGQCTVQGCDNGDPLNSIVAEIQQLRVDLFDQLNKQVQSIHELFNASLQDTIMRNLQAVDRRRSHEQDIYIKQGQSIHELLNESFQEMKSQHETVNTSLQAIYRCSKEHDIYIKQGQSIHEILNQSFQEINSHHDTIETSLQEIARRSKEQDICIKQGQSIHELLNESFKEMKSQHGTVMTNLQAVDQRLLQEHAIYRKQGQSIHELLNATLQEKKSQHDTVNMSFQEVDRCPQEHDIYSRQFQSIHNILNESFQEMKSHLETVETSLQAVDRRSEEQDIYIRQVQSIHELLNESFQQLKSQHDTLNLSLQAVDRRLQGHDISIMNQTQNSWKLANDSFDPASEVRDCSDIKASGQTTSGVYEVCVGHQLNRTCTSAFCDMVTANGSSLVFQRRKDGSVNFNRTWADYKQGFGNPNGEFWLGNEMLYLLTSKRNYKLRVDLEDFEGGKRYAEYARFFINPSDNNYRLTVSGYSGTAGDCLNYHNGKQFTTIDVDNDAYGDNCARTYGGGWWFSDVCFHANLNGRYHQRYDTVNHGMGIHWYYWHYSYTSSLKATEMKLVPVA